MKIDLNSYPLNVYNQQEVRNILETIENHLPNSRFNNSSLCQSMLSSCIAKNIGKAAGVGLLSLIDSIEIGQRGLQARECLSQLIDEQVKRVTNTPSKLILESQINIMATACITNYLSSLENSSWSNGVQNIGKAVLGIFQLKNPLNVIWESVLEISNKYENICQVYYIAFLLNVYNSVPQIGDTIKKLIIESLNDDSDGNSRLSTKKMPLLFNNVSNKTLTDNLKTRLDFLKKSVSENKRLYNPFVKWQNNFNSENA